MGYRWGQTCGVDGVVNIRGQTRVGFVDATGGVRPAKLLSLSIQQFSLFRKLQKGAVAPGSSSLPLLIE